MLSVCPRRQTGALITPHQTDGVSVTTPLLDLYGREAAAYVQAERLKAVAVVLMRLINSRSPERTSLVTFYLGEIGMKNFVLLAFVLMLTACGTTAILTETDLAKPIPSGQARIIVKREPAFSYAGAGVVVEANNQVLGTLGQGGEGFLDVRAVGVVIGADDDFRGWILAPEDFRYDWQVSGAQSASCGITRRLKNTCARRVSFADAKRFLGQSDAEITSTHAPIWKKSFFSIGVDELDAVQLARNILQRNQQSIVERKAQPMIPDVLLY